ncbi:hypothetical protein FP744_10007704 [Trichoderma asperellum]|nr:hypothetical protein LI328DRAFT_42859 [Trichoderma asperelloides]
MASAPAPGTNATLGTNPATGASDSKPKIFDKEGAVGKQFTEEGAIGGMGQSIGGPLDKEGVIGKQFTTEGAIGGTVESMMGGQKPK